MTYSPAIRPGSRSPRQHRASSPAWAYRAGRNSLFAFILASILPIGKMEVFSDPKCGRVRRACVKRQRLAKQLTQRELALVAGVGDEKTGLTRWLLGSRSSESPRSARDYSRAANCNSRYEVQVWNQPEIPGATCWCGLSEEAPVLTHLGHHQSDPRRQVRR